MGFCRAKKKKFEFKIGQHQGEVGHKEKLFVLFSFPLLGEAECRIPEPDK